VSKKRTFKSHLKKTERLKKFGLNPKQKKVVQMRENALIYFLKDKKMQ